MGKHRALALTITAGVVLTAACGDDDDAGSTATTGAPATTASAATTAAAGSTPAGGDCTLDTPLKIGYAADFSDLGGFADKPGSEAAKVQVDLINEAGGVGGKPIGRPVPRR